MIGVFAHKLLEVLQGHPAAECRLRLIDDDTPEMTRLHRDAVMQGIQVAEKFDFGQLHLERGENGSYFIPKLTGDEMEMWASGLVPLPAPICWYEFTLGTARSGLLVCENEAGEVDLDNDGRLSRGGMLSIQRYDWNPGKIVVVDGVWCSIHRDDFLMPNGDLQLILHGNRHYREGLDRSKLQNLYASCMPLVMYMTLMLSSRSTEVERVPAPERLNRARALKGRPPLPAHRVVRIVPPGYLRRLRAESGGNPRLPPRLHWRRSHVRHFDHPTPGSRPLPDGRHGVVMARCLVSKKSEAEVTHEYRVAT